MFLVFLLYATTLFALYLSDDFDVFREQFISPTCAKEVADTIHPCLRCDTNKRHHNKPLLHNVCRYSDIFDFLAGINHLLQEFTAGQSMDMLRPLAWRLSTHWFLCVTTMNK